VEERIQWADLPGSLKDAISDRTGPVKAGRAVTDGQNSPLAVVVETPDGKVFVKGMPSDHPRVRTQGREAAAAPLVTGISPELLWHFDEAGWNALGFEYIDGRPADYSPGSPDLDPIVRLMESLATIEVPDDHGPLKYADDRWKSYVTDPADAELLAGKSLIHTDWMPDNVLISAGEAWLIDWAWATLGAAWIDPACWLLRLMAHGHAPDQAEAYARRLPAYVSADASHVDAFARANVSTWNEIAESNGSRRVTTMAQAAREWADSRGCR
jgi:hypothetical protein